MPPIRDERLPARDRHDKIQATFQWRAVMHRRLHRLTILSLAIAIAAACAPGDDAADAASLEGGATDTAAVAVAQGDFAIADGVFATPESVFWDEQADMY